ncbi:hypothetical protein CGRA01v4_10280 [Colletotrichum graminicola]|uniref:Uncharacterized protein n=1 Tax=Colletotrichum graminicola (strain M1.001 / M2 / FGSC 10212) TaxID=645133 RepID=E3QD64_COLGM|nr:uncharacterized protein GLRG_03980 [Colletotrichum graminicola M1.001]EFQ28836.1 hypothetical protein GLRG_03980 [Colletotrichum graminicola M1.001]WDK18993.1 hypothetical protein CGRA01v4_10280 [Colletotrichum graminicola]
MGQFFVSWELWQQMTFILACAIGVVFVIGFIKLWWMNRYIARQEIIDAEKRAHAAELASTGLPVPPRKKSEVPFGVRAIQSGIEVDGIWISRPNTPSSEPSPNSARAKGKYVSMGPISPRSSVSDTFSSSSRAEIGPQTYRPKSTYNPGTSRADALSQLEGKPQESFAYNTYHPRSSNPISEASDESGSSLSPVDRSPYNGAGVHMPAHAPPVNRHLKNARNAKENNSQPRTGNGVRANKGNLQPPKDNKGYSGLPQASPLSEFSDPFADPQQPTDTFSDDHAILPSSPHVKFAANDHIARQRSYSGSSSGSSSVRHS